jgi:uncharacterized membrane protein
MINALVKTENKYQMTQAKGALKNNWVLGIGVFVIFLLIMIAVQLIPKVGGIISFVISGPMLVGLAGIYLSISRDQDEELSRFFDGLKKFGVSFAAYFLQSIFILLWALLLIIPGILAALSYSMTYYIISENDTIGPWEAITKSQEMMRGNRWRFFCLGFRFFGWILLCILTLGIGFLLSQKKLLSLNHKE